ncbi:MAG: DUF3060 domain-containing protein [Pyrinomonadaceae bacterium]
MKALLVTFLVLLSMFAACDLRSETAKREMEKFTSSPTPTISPTPEPEPVDPAEVVAVDVKLEGDAISINAFKEIKTAACTKFNRLMINGDDNIVAIKGPCRQIMINGDRNKISADAATEFVFNGSSNVVKYSRIVNGKRPTVTENREGNSVEKESRPTRSSR